MLVDTCHPPVKLWLRMALFPSDTTLKAGKDWDIGRKWVVRKMHVQKPTNIPTNKQAYPVEPGHFSRLPESEIQYFNLQLQISILRIIVQSSYQSLSNQTNNSCQNSCSNLSIFQPDMLSQLKGIDDNMHVNLTYTHRDIIFYTMQKFQLGRVL